MKIDVNLGFPCTVRRDTAPAFLLRQPAAKKKAWADLLMLTERLDRPERPG